MFETLVGQKSLKKKLQFYKESCDVTQKMPFLFFVGAKGLGKTEFAKQLAKEIKNTDGSRRPFLEINCSTLKRVDDFSSKFSCLSFTTTRLRSCLMKRMNFPRD